MKRSSRGGKYILPFKLLRPPDSYLVVNVIRSQASDDHANESFVDRHSLEIALRIVGWSFGSWLAGIPCTSQQLTDIIHIRISRGPSGTGSSSQWETKEPKTSHVRNT